MKKEETLMCLIASYYEIFIDHDILILALKDSSYNFLMYVWAFQKNYIGDREPKDAVMIGYEELF
jgi:hypothetical protein